MFKASSSSSSFHRPYPVQPDSGGVYRHYSGKLYEVVHFALNAKNPNRVMVVYKQLLASTLRDTQKTVLPPGTVWVTPIERFYGHYFDTSLRRNVPRFTKLQKNSTNDK